MSIDPMHTNPSAPSAVAHATAQTFQHDVLGKKGKVVVDFFAPWCGPCRAMAPVFEELAHEMKDVSFVKLDVDEHPDIAGQYNVFSIPTLIVFKDGKPVMTKVGMQQKAKFAAELQAA